MATEIVGIAGLKDLVGTHLGYSDWMEITQERVNTFADATGDHQWIHTDPERAKDGPFGGTIAHGYLTFSLGPVLFPTIATVSGIKMGVNYGADKVRFLSPVKVGANIRLAAELTKVDELPGNGAQVYMTFTFEIQDSEKPAAVAEIIFRYYE
ncbi:MAG TPA: MaoC family dehydratase [Microthrixaceae bacterium]|nr:MaoC family dehydratase [Microthrixaceae bacterium]